MALVEIDRQALAKVYDVLEGAPISDLEEWLAGNAWDTRSPLVADIDHLLAERHLMNDDEVTDALREIVGTIVITAPGQVKTGASSTTTILAPVATGNVTIHRRVALAGR